MPDRKDEIRTWGLKAAVGDRAIRINWLLAAKIGHTLKAEDAHQVHGALREIDELVDAAQGASKPGIGESAEFDGQLSRWYTCGECGAPIDRGDRYCRMCGRKVNWNDG